MWTISYVISHTEGDFPLLQRSVLLRCPEPQTLLSAITALGRMASLGSDISSTIAANAAVPTLLKFLCKQSDGSGVGPAAHLLAAIVTSDNVADMHVNGLFRSVLMVCRCWQGSVALTRRLITTNGSCYCVC